MNTQARHAIQTIRRCVAAERYGLSAHCRQRLAERGLLWADLLGILDVPSAVKGGGNDEQGRPKWIIEGKTYDGLAVGVVCVIDRDEYGQLTLFITAYWREGEA